MYPQDNFIFHFNELKTQIVNRTETHLLFRGSFWTKVFNTMKYRNSSEQPHKYKVYDKYIDEWINILTIDSITKNIFEQKIQNLNIDSLPVVGSL